MKVSIKTTDRDPSTVLRGSLRIVKKQYADEKPALDPRRPKIKAQGEMLEFWNGKWDKMISEVKDEISEVFSAIR